MKKSSFVAMISGTVGGFLLSIGMCMYLLPEWNALISGSIIGTAEMVLLTALIPGMKEIN